MFSLVNPSQQSQPQLDLQETTDSVIRLGSFNGQKNVFSVIVPDRTYHFAAESEETLAGWIGAIEILQAQNPVPQSREKPASEKIPPKQIDSQVASYLAASRSRPDRFLGDQMSERKDQQTEVWNSSPTSDPRSARDWNPKEATAFAAPVQVFPMNMAKSVAVPRFTSPSGVFLFSSYSMYRLFVQVYLGWFPTSCSFVSFTLSVSSTPQVEPARFATRFEIV